MGHGIWILIYDDFGNGLNLINPRLYTDNKGRNWFPIEIDKTTDNNDKNELKLLEQLGIKDKYIIVR